MMNKPSQVLSPVSGRSSSGVTAMFKMAMRRMASTVNIVSTTAPDGTPMGMAATAVTSLSAEPPALLVCVNRSASIHSPLLDNGRFCVNVLTVAHASLVGVFSGERKGACRFEVGEWCQDGPLPYLRRAQANLFCRIESVVEVHSHSVIVGVVEEAWVEDNVAPLVYQDGRLVGTHPLN